jgi:hypothetical protein
MSAYVGSSKRIKDLKASEWCARSWMRAVWGATSEPPSLKRVREGERE